MDNDLSIPRKEFNGHPICPWIQKYRDRITVKEVEQGVKLPLEHACSMLEPLKLMAIVLAFPKKPPIATIRKSCEAIMNRPENDHLEILISDHRLDGTVRGVYTGFKGCDLVIIQNKNNLKWARISSKKAGYYEAR